MLSAVEVKQQNIELTQRAQFLLIKRKQGEKPFMAPKLYNLVNMLTTTFLQIILTPPPPAKPLSFPFQFISALEYS